MEITVSVEFNGNLYNAVYNEQSGYYELRLTAPNEGGVYVAEIGYSDSLGGTDNSEKNVRVWALEPIVIKTNKVFMWIFDGKNFQVKDIVEILDYEINIDEETNSSSIIKVINQNNAKANDLIVIKKNGEIIYWGIIDNIQNEDGKSLYEYTTKYITNMFNQKIILQNETIIANTGIEDFIADAINRNFINNTDTFVNIDYLNITVKTHTPKQISVSNVENGIYNLHTYMTNCTQNYDIVYSFSIENNELKMEIENKTYDKQLIDTTAQSISNYREVFETDIVSKVIVLTSGNTYTLYLKTDRTTTTNPNDTDRAEGKTEVIYTENYADAPQEALNVIRTNSYNHNITFSLYDNYIKVGTPIAIKTKESSIFNTYISSVKITQRKFYEYVCGNIRINFIDKLLKERKK